MPPRAPAVTRLASSHALSCGKLLVLRESRCCRALKELRGGKDGRIGVERRQPSQARRGCLLVFAELLQRGVDNIHAATTDAVSDRLLPVPPNRVKSVFTPTQAVNEDIPDRSNRPLDLYGRARVRTARSQPAWPDSGSAAQGAKTPILSLCKSRREHASRVRGSQPTISTEAYV